MYFFVLSLFIVSFAALAAEPYKDPRLGAQAVVKKEFLAENFPTPSVHASTIVEVSPGKHVAAWFGGTNEGDSDVGIWLSRFDGKWSNPIEVANGAMGETRYPSWNPVLFQTHRKRLLLFYKVGPSPSTWRGVRRESFDQGLTFGNPVNLPKDIIGPVKNKPLELNSRLIISGSSSEDNASLPKWQVHFERSTDGGNSFNRIQVLNQNGSIDAIQPSILEHKNGSLQPIGRTKSKRIFSTFSKDQGATWAPLTLLDLPNPNSGTDAITLKDGRQLLIYNHSESERTPLSVAVSSDGLLWKQVVTLESEPGEFSYPAIILGADSMVHITYIFNRKKIVHVVIDPRKISMLNG